MHVCLGVIARVCAKSYFISVLPCVLCTHTCNNDEHKKKTHEREHNTLVSLSLLVCATAHTKETCQTTSVYSESKLGRRIQASVPVSFYFEGKV